MSALADSGGAATTTSRLAPVLPSTIVTVTVFGDFAGADGRVAVAAGGVESAGAGACGTAMTSGAFLAMCRSVGATAIGSPPERSSAVKAHNKRTEEQAERQCDDLRGRDLERGPMPSRILPKRRRQVVHCHKRFRSRSARSVSPKSATARNVQYANHGSEAVPEAGHSAGRRRPGMCGAKNERNRGGTGPPRSSLCSSSLWLGA